MYIESCACTAVGRRDNNEDALLHLPRIAPGLGLFAVADGMGGYEGGEIASHLVVDTVEEVYRRYLTDLESTWPWPLCQHKSRQESLLAAAIALAHAAVAARRSGRLANMGSTVAALVVGDNEAILAHVGDSRVYRWRDGQLCQLTRDHSLFEEVRAAGGAQQMASKRDCPFANVITRALGLSERAEPDVETVPIRAGDIFLLCSDGLSGPVSDPELLRIVEENKSDLKTAASRLIAKANENGGPDNITCCLVRWLGAAN